MADHKNIGVAPEVHALVTRIAESRGMGIGAQVTAWAKKDGTCRHPMRARRPLILAVTYPEELAQDQPDHPATGFYCRKCGHLVVSALNIVEEEEGS